MKIYHIIEIGRWRIEICFRPHQIYPIGVRGSHQYIQVVCIGDKVEILSYMYNSERCLNCDISVQLLYWHMLVIWTARMEPYLIEWLILGIWLAIQTAALYLHKTIDSKDIYFLTGKPFENIIYFLNYFKISRNNSISLQISERLFYYIHPAFWE